MNRIRPALAVTLGVLGAIVLSADLLVPMALAQTTYAQGKPKKGESATRSAQGLVTDASDNPVAGAIVQLENTKTLQIRSFITQEDGVYHFYELSSDVDYKLRAEDKKSGAASDTKTLSSFDSRKQAIINLKLNPKK
jgi:hypothetical protein